MADILAAPQQAAPRQAEKDEQLRTLGAISVAHWVSHFHIFALPMLFPFLKRELNVGYIE
ncbi:MAG TPA: MFS transporter, partial [Bradyrhizobium sp.]|nr:MFS transporter [Bradyrhizobium sp.]